MHSYMDGAGEVEGNALADAGDGDGVDKARSEVVDGVVDECEGDKPLAVERLLVHRGLHRIPHTLPQAGLEGASY